MNFSERHYSCHVRSTITAHESISERSQSLLKGKISFKRSIQIGIYCYDLTYVGIKLILINYSMVYHYCTIFREHWSSLMIIVQVFRHLVATLMTRYRLTICHKRFYSLLKQVHGHAYAYQRLLSKVVINLVISFMTTMIKFVTLRIRLMYIYFSNKL